MSDETAITVTVMASCALAFLGWIIREVKKSRVDFERLCKERAECELRLAELIKEAHTLNERKNNE
jgi:hypothetical protein